MTAAVVVIGDRRLRVTMAAAEPNQRIAVRMANASRGRAPRRTGRLAGSTRPVWDRATAAVTAGGPGIPYAGVIHWGWPARNIRPQPWLAETLQEYQSAAVAAIDERVTHIVSTIHGAT
jgi:hypothetical protein